MFVKAGIPILAILGILPAWAGPGESAGDRGVPLATVRQEQKAEERRANRAPASSESFAPEYMRSLIPHEPAWYTTPSAMDSSKKARWRLMDPKKGAFSGTSGSNVPAWRRNIYFRDFHWLPP
jgi:hypothetical protein